MTAMTIHSWITSIWLLLSSFGHSAESTRYPLQEKCITTMFGSPGDKWAGGPTACLGIPVNGMLLGIAHRRLPCGALVRVENVRTGRSIVVPVVDRGPYGATQVDGSWAVKRRPEDPGIWRGCADLTPLTGMLIGHDGWDVAHLYYAPKPRRVI